MLKGKVKIGIAQQQFSLWHDSWLYVEIIITFYICRYEPLSSRSHDVFRGTFYIRNIILWNASPVFFSFSDCEYCGRVGRMHVSHLEASGFKSRGRWPAVIFQVFRSFPQSIQANSMVCGNLKWGKHSFLIHYSEIFLHLLMLGAQISCLAPQASLLSLRVSFFIYISSSIRF